MGRMGSELVNGLLQINTGHLKYKLEDPTCLSISIHIVVSSKGEGTAEVKGHELTLHYQKVETAESKS